MLRKQLGGLPEYQFFFNNKHQSKYTFSALHSILTNYLQPTCILNINAKKKAKSVFLHKWKRKTKHQISSLDKKNTNSLYVLELHLEQ